MLGKAALAKSKAIVCRTTSGDGQDVIQVLKGKLEDKVRKF